MYKYTQVKFIKRSKHSDVIIYYSKNGEKFRPLTGVKVLNKHITKTGAISELHPNYFEDIKNIKEKQDRVEQLVVHYVERYGEKPPKTWLEKEYAKPAINNKRELHDLLAYWDDFIKEKAQTVRNEKTVQTVNNVRHALQQFREKKNHDLAFNVLDQKFFNDFISYLINEHEHHRHANQREGGAIPEVGWTNDTLIKRLTDFVEYLKYCVVEKDIGINLEKIRKYIKLAKHKLEVRPISKTSKWELTLSVEEISFTINLEYYEPEFWASLSDTQKKYLDVFMFMCLQGTAPIDTKSIGRGDIRNGKIIKDRSKSGNEFKVELDPIAEEILKRYNYNLIFTDQSANEELKRLFVTIFELYRMHYEELHEVPYEMICKQKQRKGSRDIFEVKHRGLFVELMTGRRSFLTNLGEKANELGIKETMDKAGHVVIATTLGYIHNRQQSSKKTKESLFGITRIQGQPEDSISTVQ